MLLGSLTHHLNRHISEPKLGFFCFGRKNVSNKCSLGRKLGSTKENRTFPHVIISDFRSEIHLPNTINFRRKQKGTTDVSPLFCFYSGKSDVAHRILKGRYFRTKDAQYSKAKLAPAYRSSHCTGTTQCR